MKHFPEIEPTTSIHEYVRSASQSILDNRDLDTPSPVASVLVMAEVLNPLAIFSRSIDCQTNLDQSFPTFAPLFKQIFMESLRELAHGKTGLTGLDLIRAYEHTVETVLDSLSRQVRREMFMPQQYGDFLEYFGVPVSPRIVERLQATNPVLADTYQRRAHCWSAGL